MKKNITNLRVNEEAFDKLEEFIEEEVDNRVNEYKKRIKLKSLVFGGALVVASWFAGKADVNPKDVAVEAMNSFVNAVKIEEQYEKLEDDYYKETLGGNPNNTNISENYDVYEIEGNTVFVPKDDENSVGRSR